MNAYTAWSTLAFRWMETVAASGQVIAHRTARANTPLQLFEMVHEKAAAGLESSRAVASHLPRIASASGPGMLDAWVRLMSSSLAPYHARVVKNARRSRSNTL
jgi:hypothetical protein